MVSTSDAGFSVFTNSQFANRPWLKAIYGEGHFRDVVSHFNHLSCKEELKKSVVQLLSDTTPYAYLMHFDSYNEENYHCVFGRTLPDPALEEQALGISHDVISERSAICIHSPTINHGTR
jgi:hypothetical protein